MQVTDPTTIILVLECIAHLLIIALIVVRRSLRGRSNLLLLCYVALSFLWALSQILTQFGWMSRFFIATGEKVGGCG